MLIQRACGSDSFKPCYKELVGHFIAGVMWRVELYPWSSVPPLTAPLVMTSQEEERALTR